MKFRHFFQKTKRNLIIFQKVNLCIMFHTLWFILEVQSSVLAYPESEKSKMQSGWITARWSGLLGNLMFAYAGLVGIAQRYQVDNELV